MIIEPITRSFEDFDNQSYVSKFKLLEMLEGRSQFKDELISVFKIDAHKPGVMQIGNSKLLIESVMDIDSMCKKIDIDTEIKYLHLKKMLESEKAEFEIYNITDNFILKKNRTDILVAETAYSAKTDILDYYNFSKFANYCRDKNFQDLIDVIKEYLKEKNSTNHDGKSLRLIYKNEDSKFYIRALTSISGYKDFGINFSIFVALVTLDKYVKDSKNEIYITKFKIDDSNLYISFSLKKEVKVNENIFLTFNLILENDEIKRSAVSFNGIFKLKWRENKKTSEISLRPQGLKKKDYNSPVDLLTYQHRGKVEGVFEKIKELPSLMDFFIQQVTKDAKSISSIQNPDDIRKFISDKVKNSKKAEFQVYKQQVLKKLMSISVDSTFKLFELLRDVEDLFEHDDIISLNFWRTKLYEALTRKE
ncbi:hypothetical protein [Sinomicrobium sp. M5D2P9]